MTFRLPQDMIDSVDKIIEKCGFFSNKPDFILWALRDYYAYVMHAISTAQDVVRKIDRNDPEFAHIDFESVFRHMVFNDLPNPIAYGGKTGKPILIRIPVGMEEKIRKINNSLGDPYKTIQDYCRHALAYGIYREHDRMDIFDIQMILTGPKYTGVIDDLVKAHKDSPE
jgi:hypothetical protein